jgi:hypothetical protein
MPSLRKVQDQAKRITCRNNLKQIGLAFTLYTGDNEDGSWRPIIREEQGLTGRGKFDVWTPPHLPGGGDGQRRVAKARHRDGCNVDFMDGGPDWVQAEKMTEHMWESK